MRALAPLALVLLAACPERTTPEHGVQLVYRKPEGSESVRAVVDRRLAQLKVRATLHEDGSTLTVRVPQGANVAQLKQLLGRGGALSFCREDEVAARRWCEVAWGDEVTTSRDDDRCTLQAKARPAIERALGDAGVTARFQPTAEGVTAWAESTDCIAPHVVASEPTTGDFPGLWIDFDRAGGQLFGTFTQRAVGQRILIVLDGEVTSAPVVREAITGGRAMITASASQRTELEVLGAALAGGALPKLELVKEGPYGPPSLR